MFYTPTSNSLANRLSLYSRHIQNLNISLDFHCNHLGQSTTISPLGRCKTFLRRPLVCALHSVCTGTAHSLHVTRVILLKCRSDHVTSLLKILQRLPSYLKRLQAIHDLSSPFIPSCHLLVHSTQDTSVSLLCLENTKRLPA